MSCQLWPLADVHKRPLTAISGHPRRSGFRSVAVCLHEEFGYAALLVGDNNAGKNSAVNLTVTG